MKYLGCSEYFFVGIIVKNLLASLLLLLYGSSCPMYYCENQFASLLLLLLLYGSSCPTYFSWILKAR